MVVVICLFAHRFILPWTSTNIRTEENKRCDDVQKEDIFTKMPDIKLPEIIKEDNEESLKG